jgi:4-hydroxybenzoate polyprenyltransferase
LLRPANVMTAAADVLAGYAVAGLAHGRALPWLLASTVGLYAGGVVLNDFFDRRLDAVERPERPIPSGRVPASHAAGLGSALLAGGVLSAAQATGTAAAVAGSIALLVVLYDAWGKHRPWFGPANMGLCRGLNLILGMAAVPATISGHWPLALLSFVYIAAATAVSRGEVHGGKRGPAGLALISLSGVVGVLAAIAVRSGPRAMAAIPLTIVLAWRVLPPFWKVYQDPQPGLIRLAVRAGVLSLVLVDAVIATAYAGPLYGAIVLATAVAAGLLARLFSVT